MAFRVGQRVVCIRTAAESQRGLWVPYAAAFPVVGTIYHIRSIAFDNPQSPDGLVRLAEIDNAHLMRRFHYATEPGFPVGAFRPIVERKTSIEIFTKMLTDKRENIDA
jgi:hypothetical protein